jgi:hypothetical protein
VCLGSTEVSEASRRPSRVRTLTGTSPAGVASRYVPSPSVAPSTTPVAMVAWPQNGTSASGLK